jgi:uncharacterized membrane protein YdfJ with MMPL/SSD domain
MGLYKVHSMIRPMNLTLLVTLYCLLTSAFIMYLSLDVSTSHASSSSSFLPEKNSTLSNSSASDFENGPITIIISPNEDSSSSPNSSSNNVTNLAAQSDNITIDTNNSSDVTNNETSSDSQQRGEYLVDDNGIHYYNIDNCSEKKGSSGIGDMSECEDAEREMSLD